MRSPCEYVHFLVNAVVLCGFALVPPHVAHSNDLITYEIKPSEADPTITRFNEPNYVVFDPASTPQSQLVVFMPATAGKPKGGAQLYAVVAAQGYRVIGLEYNDSPAVVQVCPQNPSPSCSGSFRQKRIFGDDATHVVDNTREESIVNRLVKLLTYLSLHDTQRQWATYLLGSEPDWSRIVVSGLSQGAGMAAYIAKQKTVARVVLFSSPWDFQGRPPKTLAPWLANPTATPPDRWFAEYHRRENTAALIAHAYEVLRIPASNVRVFDLDVPANAIVKGDNPFHTGTTRWPAYAREWTFLFGRSP